MEKKYFLAVDVETTGRCIQENHLAAVGAALVDASVAPPKVVDEFLVYLKMPKEKKWEQRCLDEFWLKPENKQVYETTKAEIEDENCPTVKKGMDAFQSWVLRATAGRDVLLVSDTAGFDFGWIDAHLSGTSSLYLLGTYKPTRDMSSWCVGVSGVSPFDAVWDSKKLACKQLKMEPPVFPEHLHDHNPSNDAKTIGMTFAVMYQQQQLINMEHN